MATNATTLLSPRQVADELDVSRSTVYRHIQAGSLAAVRVGHDGRTLRVSRDAVSEWLTPVVSAHLERAETTEGAG